jgi:hypothetical protein
VIERSAATWMWIRTLGMGAFLWGLFMMMGDMTAVVQCSLLLGQYGGVTLYVPRMPSVLRSSRGRRLST